MNNTHKTKSTLSEYLGLAFKSAVVGLIGTAGYLTVESAEDIQPYMPAGSTIEQAETNRAQFGLLLFGLLTISSAAIGVTYKEAETGNQNVAPSPSLDI